MTKEFKFPSESNESHLEDTLNGLILFAAGDEGGEEHFRDEELLLLSPYGLSLATDVNRPTLLLKDESKEYVLAVPLSPIEAGVALGQSNKALAPSSPHRFVETLMQSLDIKIQRCVFVEIKGLHQYVRLYLEGHKDLSSFKMRADEVISLCLHLKVPILASRSFIDRSKVLTAEIKGLQKSSLGSPLINALRRGQGYIQ